MWHRCAHVAEVRSPDQGQAALLNLTHARPLVLHGSALIIWELIDGTRTQTEMLDELRDIYGTGDRAQIDAQLTLFLGELATLGLAESRIEEEGHHG